MANKYWSTKKLLGHIFRLNMEMRLYPDDGSIELELEETTRILLVRGVFE